MASRRLPEPGLPDGRLANSNEDHANADPRGLRPARASSIAVGRRRSAHRRQRRHPLLRLSQRPAGADRLDVTAAVIADLLRRGASSRSRQAGPGRRSRGQSHGELEPAVRVVPARSGTARSAPAAAAECRSGRAAGVSCPGATFLGALRGSRRRLTCRAPRRAAKLLSCGGVLAAQGCESRNAA